MRTKVYTVLGFALPILLRCRLFLVCSETTGAPSTPVNLDGAQHTSLDVVLQGILEKVGIKKRPMLSFAPIEAPSPMLEEARHRFSDASSPTQSDKQPFRSRQGHFMVALQPAPDFETCTGVTRKACQPVRIPPSVYQGRAVAARLWMFQETPSRSTTVVPLRLRGYFRNARSYHETELAVTAPASQVGWFSENATELIKWFDAMDPVRKYTVMMIIYPNDMAKTTLGASGVHRPTIVFSLKNDTDSTTPIPCDASKPADCCRQTMMSDVKNVGWGDWSSFPRVQEFICSDTCGRIIRPEVFMSSNLC